MPPQVMKLERMIDKKAQELGKIETAAAEQEKLIQLVDKLDLKHGTVKQNRLDNLAKAENMMRDNAEKIQVMVSEIDALE